MEDNPDTRIKYTLVISSIRRSLPGRKAAEIITKTTRGEKLPSKYDHN